MIPGRGGKRSESKLCLAHRRFIDIARVKKELVGQFQNPGRVWRVEATDMLQAQLADR
jgi:hypothetical protein